MITLHAGFHVPQFDASTCQPEVPVPKSAQYPVHFLLPEPVHSERYHNVIFTGDKVTSGRLLLSRFCVVDVQDCKEITFDLVIPVVSW